MTTRLKGKSGAVREIQGEQLRQRVVDFLNNCANLESQGRRRISTRKTARSVGLDRPRREPRVRFLTELEIRGDVRQAAKASGCTPADVGRWRASDPMFSRDFVLAVTAHIRTLKRIVEEAAVSGETDATRLAAHRLLRSEGSFRDHAGRLDAYAWSRALQSFSRAAGQDVASWEPLANEGVA